MTGEEMSQCDVPDKLAMFSYLTQIYEVFRKEIPHIKHPKLVHKFKNILIVVKLTINFILFTSMIYRN